jgi:hypothetical protein
LFWEVFARCRCIGSQAACEEYPLEEIFIAAIPATRPGDDDVARTTATMRQADFAPAHMVGAGAAIMIGYSTTRVPLVS